MADKPRVGLLLGDPAGIGPEIAARLLADPHTTEQAHVVIIGDPQVWQMGKESAGISAALTDLDSIPTVDAPSRRDRRTLLRLAQQTSHARRRFALRR